VKSWEKKKIKDASRLGGGLEEKKLKAKVTDGKR